MWSSSALRPREVPVEPDAAQAQQWALDELSRSIYDTSPSLWQRAVNWFLEQLGNLFMGSTTATSALVVLLIAALLIAAVVIVVLYRGRLRRNRAVGGGRGDSARLFDDARSSDDLWADARALAGSGEWTRACLDAFRGIVRSLDERVLLDETPGMTAHEAAIAGSAIFPEFAEGWRWGGGLFDALAYGDRDATEADWNGLTAFAHDIERATPARRLAAAQ